MQDALILQVENLLKQDDRLVSQDGYLLKNKIQELSIKLDPQLIELLLKDKITKDKFFIKVLHVFVFDKDKFLKFVNNKEFLPDSYTAFKNKIWLADSRDEFIADKNDVVLNRPYKDCILAGWQDREDSKRDEIFYNEILWADQIDRLLDPKVFTNFKRIDKDGEHELTERTKDENGDIKDNLIIKGNNLLVLHSLKKKFANKVKLIYIDPPYNTGNDWFKYNDKFNHSTRLTFMKNRLEVARELLRDDGVIFVQCDDNEQAYLKVLMDEVFGRENLISTIIYKRRWSQANLSKNISPIHDYIHTFAKTDILQLNRINQEIDETQYKNPDNDSRWPYVTMPCTNRWWAKYKIITPTWKEIEDEWRFKKETYIKLEKENKLVFPNNWEWKPRYKLFLSEKKEKWVIPNTIRDDVSSNQEANKEVNILLWENVFSYPKAEQLINRIINLWSNEWDIVLDYHLWSGTTCAVAHKMWRQYIGIEQMDYIETVSVERIKKMIQWEQGWISKEVEREGWWNFVYMELAQDNETYRQRINQTTTKSDIVLLYQEIRDNAFINYKVNTDLINDNITEFEKLSLDEMKQFLINLLEQNALYLNFSEIESSNIKEKMNKYFLLSKNFYKW